MGGEPVSQAAFEIRHGILNNRRVCIARAYPAFSAFRQPLASQLRGDQSLCHPHRSRLPDRELGDDQLFVLILERKQNLGVADS